jgi:hypothetical protein
VRTKDVNGPRGGVDIRCTVTAELTMAKQRVVVRNKSVDAYAAIQGAALSGTAQTISTYRRRSRAGGGKRSVLLGRLKCSRKACTRMLLYGPRLTTLS